MTSRQKMGALNVFLALQMATARTNLTFTAKHLHHVCNITKFAEERLYAKYEFLNRKVNLLFPV